MTHEQSIRHYLKTFRREHPLQKYFIKFAQKDIKDAGLCYGPYVQKKTGKKYIYIVIDKKMPAYVKSMVLVHEYSHALAMDRGLNFEDEQKDHGKHWGSCYSEVYRTFLKIAN